MISAATSAHSPKPIRGQVVTQKSRSAAHVVACELGAIALHVIVGAPQVADVVEQRQHHAEQDARGGELLGRRRLPLMGREQSHHRERHVQGVLPVVINGIDACVPGGSARGQLIEIAEGALDRTERHFRPFADQQLLHRAQHLSGRADAHGVGNVVVAASGTGHKL